MRLIASTLTSKTFSLVISCVGVTFNFPIDELG